jgi:hypothetical protein
MSAERKIYAIPAGAEDDFSGSDDDDFYYSDNRPTLNALPRPPGVDQIAGGNGDGHHCSNMNTNTSPRYINVYYIYVLNCKVRNIFTLAMSKKRILLFVFQFFRNPVGNMVQRSKDQIVEDFKSALSTNQIEVAKQLLTDNFDPNATSRYYHVEFVLVCEWHGHELCI